MDTPALQLTPDGFLIDVTIGSLRLYTPEPVTEDTARRYVRQLWDSFGVEIAGDFGWL